MILTGSSCIPVRMSRIIRVLPGTIEVIEGRGGRERIFSLQDFFFPSMPILLVPKGGTSSFRYGIRHVDWLGWFSIRWCLAAFSFQSENFCVNVEWTMRVVLEWNSLRYHADTTLFASLIRVHEYRSKAQQCRWNLYKRPRSCPKPFTVARIPCNPVISPMTILLILSAQWARCPFVSTKHLITRSDSWIKSTHINKMCQQAFSVGLGLTWSMEHNVLQFSLCTSFRND